MTGIEQYRSWLDRHLASHERAVGQVSVEKARLTEAEAEEAVVISAQDFLQKAAQGVQKRAHRQIARVVSKCLSAVFEEPYELRIEFPRRRGKTEAVFTYRRGGNAVNPRVTSGGVRDVASLALRLTALVLAQPPARKLLVLDEPFKGLSKTNLQKAAVLIESLAKELSVQFLIVTHNESLMVGEVIEI